MKFNVSSKTLYNFASSVSKVINAKNPMPILNNFLFTLDGDTLTVKAADMENYLIGRVPVAESEGSGSFCLDARRIVELFKELPDQGIEVSINEANMEVTISYSNGVYNTVAINGMEYPGAAVDDNGPKETFVCSTEQVLRGIDSTMFAVSVDEIRPQMMGILWDIKPDKMVFVATDTRKLVRYTNTQSQPGVECSFILPVKGASVLKNVFAKEDEIKVTVSEKSVLFESASFTFECRLIKGVFPPYNKVIPQNNPYVITIDRLSLLNGVRRVSVFGDQGGGLVKFKLSSDLLTLKASDNSFGTSGSETVPCSYDGQDMVMGFSSMFLIEILSTFNSPDIMLKIADPSRPAICLPAENAPDEELLMLLMPMNISE